MHKYIFAWWTANVLVIKNSVPPFPPRGAGGGGGGGLLWALSIVQEGKIVTGQ